ncbi:MAG: hypothetical protein K9W44_00795 [Candidatus Lokiarchaeota archaeon]|nr:hypothetical protein [Candidatus Harpocratesius repetitus]
MKKYTKSLFSLSVSLLFAFSLITQALILDLHSQTNPTASVMMAGDPFNASYYNESNSSHPIQPVELKEDQMNDLGQIEIYGFSVREELRPTAFFREDIQNIHYDHDVETVNPKFDSTTRVASAVHASGNTDSRNSSVEILLNETVKWTYTENTTSFVVGFAPYVQPATFFAMYLNGTKLDSTNYSVEEQFLDGIYYNWFYYNFTTLFNAYSSAEFLIKYQYTVEIPISNWKVINQPILPDENEESSEYQNPFQYITGIKNNVTMPYVYNVTFGREGWLFNVTAKFLITLPDPDDIFAAELKSYSNQVIDELPYTLENNSIKLNIWTFLDQRETLSTEFKANFTVEILESIDGEQFWCEDRLVDGTRNRERDYKLTVSEGPADLMVAMFGINDTSIYFDDLNEDRNDRIESALNREVVIIDMNRSEGQPSGTIISGNQTLEYVDGISMLISGESYLTPYALFKGEVDIITVKYRATRNLNLIITDNTKTPVAGIKVDIYFASQPFGSKISLYDSLPYPVKTSDNEGRIVIYGVPIGDYTIEILDNSGQHLQNLTASSLIDENLIITNIPHFPLVIIIFGVISAVFIVTGLIIYKKNQ